MKRIIFLSTLAALLSAPAIAQGLDTTPAGRPGKILNEADCQAVWNKAGGKELAEKAAEPYVTNFEQVDKDGDNKITKAEFDAGCSIGWVEADGSQTGSKTN
jgi:hypothetical protein